MISLEKIKFSFFLLNSNYLNPKQYFKILTLNITTVPKCVIVKKNHTFRGFSLSSKLKNRGINYLYYSKIKFCYICRLYKIRYNY